MGVPLGPTDVRVIGSDEVAIIGYTNDKVLDYAIGFLYGIIIGLNEGNVISSLVTSFYVTNDGNI